jgi:hypothetical protein
MQQSIRSQQLLGPSAVLLHKQLVLDGYISRYFFSSSLRIRSRFNLPIGSDQYYLDRVCDYQPNLTTCNQSFVPLAFPYGFRMIAGNSSRRYSLNLFVFLLINCGGRTQNESDFTQTSILMMCIYDGGTTEHPGFPTRPCDTIRAEVYFPSCWDGKNLDSPDHQSHV